MVTGGWTNSMFDILQVTGTCVPTKHSLQRRGTHQYPLNRGNFYVKMCTGAAVTSGVVRLLTLLSLKLNASLVVSVHLHRWRLFLTFNNKSTISCVNWTEFYFSPASEDWSGEIADKCSRWRGALCWEYWWDAEHSSSSLRGIVGKQAGRHERNTAAKHKQISPTMFSRASNPHKTSIQMQIEASVCSYFKHQSQQGSSYHPKRKLASQNHLMNASYDYFIHAASFCLKTTFNFIAPRQVMASSGALQGPDPNTSLRC